MNRCAALSSLSIVSGCLLSSGCGGASSSPASAASWNEPLLTDERGEGRTSEVRVESGRLRGVKMKGAVAFRGIPYAAAPTGDLRFRPPAPAVSWPGVRDAAAYGPCCPQRREGGGVEGDEDCLSLNVFAPAQPSSALRPVLVFLHGGGHSQGCSAQISMGQRIYGGETLASVGDIIVVTLNYRLGALGYLAHPALGAEQGQRSEGNYGLLDQQAALGWVSRNIAAFGGDPSRVTLLGASSGAVDVCAHLVSRDAAGLFQSAMMQSGACPDMPLTRAEAQGARVVDALGCSSDTATCLRALPASKIVDAAPGVGPFDRGARFSPNIDGRALTELPIETIAAGKHSHMPLLIGADADETLAWSRSMLMSGERGYRARVRSWVGERQEELVLRRYAPSAYGDARSAFVAAMTDAFFVCPGRTLARAASATQQSPVFRYFFSHRPERVRRGGATQGLELLFVFDHLKPSGYLPSSEEEALSREMMGYWSRFVKTGDPNGDGAPSWPIYQPSADNFLSFGDRITEGAGLHAGACDFWDSVLLP